MTGRNQIRTDALLIAISSLLGVAHSYAVAAEKEFEASLRLGAAKLDNVFLVPPGNEVDDLAYVVSPMIGFDYESTRWDANLEYTYAWFQYSDLDIDSSYSNYLGSVTGKALDEALQLEVGAERRQVLRDPGDVIPPNQLPLSGNLSDQDVYFANPRFLKTFRVATTLKLDYRYEEITYDDPTTQGNSNQDALFSLDNYAKGQGLTWALRYLWQQTEYELAVPWEYQRASAELGFWANSHVRLFVNAGKESPWDDPVDSSLTDPFWEAGFAYSVKDRLRAEFAVGEREFGSSWRGEIDYTFKRGNTVFSYAETPTTVGLRGRRQAILQVDPGEIDDDFLSQPGSAERYLSKHLQWLLNLDTRHTLLTLRVFDEERSDRTQPDGTPLEDLQQRGASFDFSMQLGIRTEIAVHGQFINRQNEFGDENEFLSVSGHLGYKLTRRVELTAAYTYSEQTPVSGSTFREYVANVVGLYVTLSL
jgi:hypothetical protein